MTDDFSFGGACLKNLCLLLVIRLAA